MKVVSFFAGCGGLDLGFEQAGFDVVWANELEPHCSATYIRNHKNTKFVLGDVCEIDPDTIPDCDGFIGGPPCQSWSVGGKQKGLDDERGQLFIKYIELINVKKPKFFLIENVKGLLDDKFKDIFNDFISRLEGSGYDVQWELLDAVNYRVPQNRERVFLVGFRKELNITFRFPQQTCDTPITLRQAIGDIEETPKYYSGTKADNIIINEHSNNHDVLTSKYGSFYYRGNRRRGWQQPSFTINATAEFAPLHPSSPKMMYFGHENWSFQKGLLHEYRRLSVRECARIQTFPDDFIFEYSNIKDAYKMIGNAVPPRLSNELAKSLLSALNGFKTEQSFVHGAKSHKECVLVGYYKNEQHYNCIMDNLLYYVRSDGRAGSMFKENCEVIPKYLLIHHKQEAEIFELDAEEPILTDGAYLRNMGFKCSGDKYMCFRLKDQRKKTIQELGGNTGHPVYDMMNFAPYITTLENIISSPISEE